VWCVVRCRASTIPGIPFSDITKMDYTVSMDLRAAGKHAAGKRAAGKHVAHAGRMGA
jgi:hypothetical protein